METVTIMDRGRTYLSMTIGELLHESGLAPDYESGAALAKTGTVVIEANRFKRATVVSDREHVTFDDWCDITIGNKTLRVLVGHE